MRIWLLAVVLAGCFTPVPKVGEFTGIGAWDEPTGDLWAVMTWGCGFCSGDTESPEFSGIAYYRGGAVLTFEYGYWNDGQRLDVPEQYKPFVSDVVNTDIYANGTLRVHSIGVEIIEPSNFEDSFAFYVEQNGHNTKQDAQVLDCGPTHLQVDDEVMYLGCEWDASNNWWAAQKLLQDLYHWTQDG